MKYQFILSYKATDSDEVLTNTCHPVYGDDLSVTIDREDDEWHYKRKLDGKITFVRDDYRWIMARPFDGTFTLTVNETHDGGASWHPYFEGTFSRANLEIDEDNQAASLSSFIEGVYNAIENGKDEDYDLMKIIPDGDAKEVQGIIFPALALVDDRSDRKPTYSNVFCGSASISGGYISDDSVSAFWGLSKNMYTNPYGWLAGGVYAEAKVKMQDSTSTLNGLYTGKLDYWHTYNSNLPGDTSSVKSVYGDLESKTGYKLKITFNPSGNALYVWANLLNGENVPQDFISKFIGGWPNEFYSPSSIKILSSDYPHETGIESIEFIFHYIFASLLTASSDGVQENILDNGPYYKGITSFYNGGLTIYASNRTVEQPNGHRLVPGTGEQGTTPQYFAPPVDNNGWIPLIENDWTYGSFWYKIIPSVYNGMLNPNKYGSFRWTRCWTLGTVLRHLLDRITDGKVVFSEDTTSSQFLYSTVNPVNQHEPFDYLITQKSNVMRPSSGESAARCPVRLNWFLELLRNAFNCYYWLEKRNDGKYLFRVEHVEYFRRGGHYDWTLPAGIDITILKPRRNFRNQLNQLAKTYADQTNKYAYNMQNMVEKYTFSWQGDGGSDAFKGNPMFFKAGWIEKSSSEDHQVDNFFADLAWLMLNSGTDTASSKNYDGVFLFSGYQPALTYLWSENSHPTEQTLTLAQGDRLWISANLWINIPQGYTINVIYNTGSSSIIYPYTGTGNPQLIELNYIGGSSVQIDFGVNYSQVTILRYHADQFPGNVYNVPNTADMLNPSNYLQNGPLAWPWLQNEHLHYDIPANKWCYKHDNLQDITTEDWEANGTVKMIQKQTVKPVPITDKGTEDSIMDITGIHTSIEGGKTGIITNAKINLSSRNAELTIVYDPMPEQQ